MGTDFSPIGVWNVVSYVAEDPKTGIAVQLFGEHPLGAAIYTG